MKSGIDWVERVGGKITGGVLNDVKLSGPAQNYHDGYYHSYGYGNLSVQRGACGEV